MIRLAPTISIQMPSTPTASENSRARDFAHVIGLAPDSAPSNPLENTRTVDIRAEVSEPFGSTQMPSPPSAAENSPSRDCARAIDLTPAPSVSNLLEQARAIDSRAERSEPLGSTAEPSVVTALASRAHDGAQSVVKSRIPRSSGETIAGDPDTGATAADVADPIEVRNYYPDWQGVDIEIPWGLRASSALSYRASFDSPTDGATVITLVPQPQPGWVVIEEETLSSSAQPRASGKTPVQLAPVPRGPATAAEDPRARRTAETAIRAMGASVRPEWLERLSRWIEYAGEVVLYVRDYRLNDADAARLADTLTHELRQQQAAPTRIIVNGRAYNSEREKAGHHAR